MGLLSAKQDESVMAEINITPFTDVLLVLLIIFIILAAIKTPPGFEKELPNKSNNVATQNNNKNDINITVTDKNVIFVGTDRTNAKGIYAEMLRVRAKRGNKHVSIAADEKSSYGIIIRILDACSIAGLDDVGFVTG